MNMQNYDLLIERIAVSSGLEKEEIEKRVEAKRAKLSGLISKEGAAQIVAAELGVSFDNVQLKISELIPGMKKVNLVGKVITLFPVREFEKNGKKGKVANFYIGDETGSMKIVLWDTNHIGLIESGVVKEGVVVEIANAGMREGELHLGSFSEFKKSNQVLENVKTERGSVEKSIEEIQQGQNVKLRAVIVQMFTPRFFKVCPECGKKAIESADGFSCNEHGKIQPKERALINFVLDDGTENIRAVLFSEQIEKLISEDDLKDAEKFQKFKDDYLGAEIYISGSARQNKLFNNVELIATDVEKVDVEKLIKEMEAR